MLENVQESIELAKKEIREDCNITRTWTDDKDFVQDMIDTTIVDAVGEEYDVTITLEGEEDVADIVFNSIDYKRFMDQYMTRHNNERSQTTFYYRLSNGNIVEDHLDVNYGRKR